MPETTEHTEEYRVVGDYVDRNGETRGMRFESVTVTGKRLDWIERQVESAKGARNIANVRIQTRTVTRTPWVDLDDGEGSDAS